MWALNRTASAEDCTVVISTGHKAKGREWKSVRLIDDFARSKPRKGSASPAQLDLAELRLLYVAITRAKECLDIPTSLIDLINGREAARIVGPHIPEQAALRPSASATVTVSPTPVTPKNFVPSPEAIPTPAVTPKPSATAPTRQKRTGLLKWLLGE